MQRETLIGLVAVLSAFTFAAAQNMITRNITLRAYATVREYNQIVNQVEAIYVEGDNFTEADSFVWTLPDLTILKPGENNTQGYQAEFAQDNIFGRINKWYNLILPGARINGSTITFTASGPAAANGQPRWTKSESYTYIKIEPHRPELIQTNVYTDDGSIRVNFLAIGGYPEETSVSWILPSGTKIGQCQSLGTFRALKKNTSSDGARTYTLVVAPRGVRSHSNEFIFLISSQNWVVSYSSEIPLHEDYISTTPSNTSSHHSMALSNLLTLFLLSAMFHRIMFE